MKVKFWFVTTIALAFIFIVLYFPFVAISIPVKKVFHRTLTVLEKNKILVYFGNKFDAAKREQLNKVAENK